MIHRFPVSIEIFGIDKEHEDKYEQSIYYKLYPDETNIIYEDMPIHIRGNYTSESVLVKNNIEIHLNDIDIKDRQPIITIKDYFTEQELENSLDGANLTFHIAWPVARNGSNIG